MRPERVDFLEHAADLLGLRAEAHAAASGPAGGARGIGGQAAPPFRLNRRPTPSGGPGMLAVAGEIDFDCALPAAAGGLDLDLSAVVFCDCAFVNALLAVRRRVLATGHALTLSSCSRTVARLLDLTDVRDAFPPPEVRLPPGNGPGTAVGSEDDVRSLSTAKGRTTRSRR